MQRMAPHGNSNLHSINSVVGGGKDKIEAVKVRYDQFRLDGGGLNMADGSKMGLPFSLQADKDKVADVHHADMLPGDTRGGIAMMTKVEGGRQPKAVTVSLAVVEGKAVGGAMTLDQWRAMLNTRPELMAASTGLNAGNEESIQHGDKADERPDRVKNAGDKGDWECMSRNCKRVGGLPTINFRKADKCTKCGAYRRMGQSAYQAPKEEASKGRQGTKMLEF
mmetsp:Transcript_15351/g.24503  ORF Transcript_15351/g.24503 Transcript_15351/m.24503 type:complete len:222 (+) Transcript_15351:377-1042(+)